MKKYTDLDVLIILKNFGKDHNVTSGIKIKNWWIDWMNEHPQCLKTAESESKNLKQAHVGSNEVVVCPDCGGETMEIREFTVCKEFGCKWQKARKSEG